MVFVDLAKKAPKLLNHTSLIGWLHTATRKAVVGELRKEYRRLKRERMAWQMEQDPGGGETKTDASNLRPVVDELLQKLNDSDREAVSSRFFLGHSFKQIGETLDTTEDAARMRVDRALEKLRSAAARRGIGSTVAIFAALLEAEGQLAAPEGMARSIAQAASSAPSGTPASTQSAHGVAVASAGKIAIAVILIGAGIAGVSFHVRRRTSPPAHRSAAVGVVSTKEVVDRALDRRRVDRRLVPSARAVDQDYLRITRAYAFEMVYALNERNPLKLSLDQMGKVVTAYCDLQATRAAIELKLASVDSTTPGRAVVTIPSYPGETLFVEFAADLDRTLGSGMGDKVFSTYGPWLIARTHGAGEYPQTITLGRQRDSDDVPLVSIVHRQEYSFLPISRVLKLSGPLSGDVTVTLHGPVKATGSSLLQERDLDIYEFLRPLVPAEATH